MIIGEFKEFMEVIEFKADTLARFDKPIWHLSLTSERV